MSDKPTARSFASIAFASFSDRLAFFANAFASRIASSAGIDRASSRSKASLVSQREASPWRTNGRLRSSTTLVFLFELLPEDRDVLDQVAGCLSTGPLHGRTVQLVGRADPRGTEEYNLGLGARRAAGVREYLQHLGVSPGQLSQTTRGALDATGTDEAGWHDDRRVDLRLASR
jgi:outer membrane protein OmpA-like peptidoglycan-associated protein